MEAAPDFDSGFNSDVYSDHKLCIRRKRKRDDDGEQPQQIGVVKVVLARASAFFKAVFESPMRDPDSSPGITYVCLDDGDCAVDLKELQCAFLHVVRCAHVGALQGVPTMLLPVVLHLADKYLFKEVVQLSIQAMEKELAANRDVAMRALCVCSIPDILALRCIESLSADLTLADVYRLMEMSFESQDVALKARNLCSQYLVLNYGMEWPEHTSKALLELELPAFDLLLQSDDLVVRSENMVFVAIVDWTRFKPCRKSYFEQLWGHVRKYYMTTGFVLEVVANSMLVSDREIQIILKKRLGSLYRYEWGQARAYHNPPMVTAFPLLAPGAKWQTKVQCNGVEVGLTYESSAEDHTHELFISVGGYSPVLQRELHAEAILSGGKRLPCKRWIAGSSRILIPEYEQCQGMLLRIADCELLEKEDQMDIVPELRHESSDA